jgi:outer membrane lipoprotein-sorting protein
MTVDYADFRPVAGLTLPFKETRLRGGEKEATVELKDVELNPSVDPKLFEKPEAKPGEKSP